MGDIFRSFYFHFLILGDFRLLDVDVDDFFDDKDADNFHDK